MHNLEYYGFSLLCRVQQSCNSHFKTAPDFFGSSPSRILDFSGLSEGIYSDKVAEFDLVGRLLSGELSQASLGCLAEACKHTGTIDRLYKLSQWEPDRKRSALIMYKGNSKEWLAVSFGDQESLRVHLYGGYESVEGLQKNSRVKGIISSCEIGFSSLECSKICEKFMDLARERGLFSGL